MTFVKGTVLLLLLAAVNTFAEPEDCDHVAVLETKDFDQIVGDWVLVWAVAKKSCIDMNSINSSLVEISLNPDNHTFSHTERNMQDDGSCTAYSSTANLPTEYLRAELFNSTVQQNGTVNPFNDNATVEFLKTCPESMMMIYEGNVGKFLLFYVKYGHHEDTEKNKACHKVYELAARCHKIPTDDVFIYKAAGDFCHKKSSSEQD